MGLTSLRKRHTWSQDFHMVPHWFGNDSFNVLFRFLFSLVSSLRLTVLLYTVVFAFFVFSVCPTFGTPVSLFIQSVA